MGSLYKIEWMTEKVSQRDDTNRYLAKKYLLWIGLSASYFEDKVI